jgi:hypothetical protein
LPLQIGFIALAFKMKPGVSMIVRLGEYAYSALRTMGLDETVAAHRNNTHFSALQRNQYKNFLGPLWAST